jgi:hypothetical protein
VVVPTLRAEATTHQQLSGNRTWSLKPAVAEPGFLVGVNEIRCSPVTFVDSFDEIRATVEHTGAVGDQALKQRSR